MTDEYIASKFIDLFIDTGDDSVNVYKLKHYMEEFSRHFFGEFCYISADTAEHTLLKTGYTIDNKYLMGMKWVYPKKEQISDAIGKDFLIHFKLDADEIPFFDIPSIRTHAMIEAYSGIKKEGKDRHFFPTFSRYGYENLNWIEIDNKGVLAYGNTDGYENEPGTIMLDTIFVTEKRQGIGTQLFEQLLHEISTLHPDTIIGIDAYTKDSKALFSSLSKKYSFLTPSNIFQKPDVYQIKVGDIPSEV